MLRVPGEAARDGVLDVPRLADAVAFARVAHERALDPHILQRDEELLGL